MSSVNIDSLSLSIPMSYVKVLDSELLAKYQARNIRVIEMDDSSGQILAEEVNPRKQCDLDKAFYVDSDGSLTHSLKYCILSVRYGRETIDCLRIAVNSKFLKERYFDGINRKTVKLAYQAIIEQGVVHFSFLSFMKGMVNDVDLFIDHNIDSSMKTVSESIGSAVRPEYKANFKYFNRGNTGFQVFTRGYGSSPYFKFYNKKAELSEGKSLLFAKAFLSDVVIPDGRFEVNFKTTRVMRQFGLIGKAETSSLLNVLNGVSSSGFSIVNTIMDRYFGMVIFGDDTPDITPTTDIQGKEPPATVLRKIDRFLDEAAIDDIPFERCVTILKIFVHKDSHRWLRGYVAIRHHSFYDSKQAELRKIRELLGYTLS